MILDNERQREIILNLIKTSNFSGDLVDDVFDFKKAVTDASVGDIMDVLNPGDDDEKTDPA